MVHRRVLICVALFPFFQYLVTGQSTTDGVDVANETVAEGGEPVATEDTEVEAQPNPSPSDSLPITTFDRNSVRVPWGGCVDPRYPGSDKIEIGKRTVVCFHIGNSINWAGGVEYIRVSFAPVADQYSRLHIPNSFNDLIGRNVGSIFQDRNVTIGAASQDKLSFLRMYYEETPSYVFPFLTAIVDVRDGVVRGITWDDACVFCGTDDCLENTFNYNGIEQSQRTSGQPTRGCVFTKQECNEFANDGNRICDLTIYVVWTGTDANGIAFQSSAYRFSQFPPQKIRDRIGQSFFAQRVPETGRDLAEAVTVPMEWPSP